MIRDRVRRWWRRLRGRGPALWYHPSFRLPVAGIHVSMHMDPRRADDVLTWALSRRLVAPDDVFVAPELSWEDAALVHHHEYLESLDQPETLARILGIDQVVIPVSSMLETWRRGAGGTLEAARFARRTGRRAMTLLGGFHHAEPHRGAGFCAINDIAVAARRLRAEGLDDPIVVIDLDAHPPDGTVASLHDDAGVHILSLGVASEWSVPPSTAATCVDVRVPAGTTDTAYLGALEQLLDELPRRPGLVLYLAGADALADDPLGDLGISEAGLRQRDRMVIERVGRCPLVVMPGGGYRPDSWRVIAGTVSELVGDHDPVPADWEPLQHRTREVARRLDPVQLGDRGWLTAEELNEALGVPTRTREPRLLGFYTRHGLEYALTEYGYLPAVAAMGFEDIRVEMEVERMPHRLRITADLGSERATLVDLSLSIQRLEPGFQILFIEWLELTDPRLTFTAQRPRLPGQQAPGLGLAEETGALLLRAAERLGLDGVGLVPAHYHVAVMGEAQFTFVDPEIRGRYRALRAHLARVPLARATHVLGGPGLKTADGARILWQPSWMVLPVSPSLAQRIADTEDAAREAEAALTARLQPWRDEAPPEASSGGASK